MYMMEKDIKKLAWNTFKQTGNINTFMELMQVENMEQKINLNTEANIMPNNKGRIENNIIENQFEQIIEPKENNM